MGKQFQVWVRSAGVWSCSFLATGTAFSQCTQNLSQLDYVLGPVAYLNNETQ